MTVSKPVHARSMVAMLLCTLVFPLSVFGEGRDAALRNRDANQAFEANDFEQATDLYDDALTLEPESGVISYNLGNALYRQGQFEEATTALLRGMLSEDPQVRQSSLYNLGNAFVQLQKYPEALTAYRKALEIDPHDLQTKVNFEKALQLMQQQQQEQQQQQQQDKGDEEGEGEQQQDPQSGDQEQQENQDQQGDQQQDENQQNQEQQQQDQQDSEGEQEQEQQQEEQEPQEAQADSMRAVGEMTPEEAMRILDAMREQEKELQKEKARQAQARMRGVEKDW